jgi:hypothetical protein
VADRKPPIFRSEIRNTNIEIRNNDKNTNAPITKITDFKLLSFGHFLIWYSDLFRVSDFDIRILPEHDFSFRHESVYLKQDP